MDGKIKAPGLKWRKLASGGYTPIWIADENDVRNGYRPKTLNLSDIADLPAVLVARCNAAQADMLLWRAGYRHDPLKFDGTVKSLLSIYQRHPESPFHDLKPGTLRPYRHYLAKLEEHIGPRRIDEISGVDIKRWHKAWSQDGLYLSAAATARAVFEAALSFGILMRLPGAHDLSIIAKEARKKLPQPQPRTATATADQVIAARVAAHNKGRPSSALAYALVFETTLRLWDVIGQWWPIEREGMSDIIDQSAGMKWFGLRWEDVGEDLVLRFTPSKTKDTTGKEIAYPLAKAPMVVEELAHWPAESRKGPIIVSEESGLPYHARIFGQRWTVDRKAAGLPSSLWARDLRASGITEGRASNASTDDAAKVAGHASTRTTSKVYDRAVLEAAGRFADARLKGRERSGNGSGNTR